MSVEQHLREYRSTLDAATEEAAARSDHRAATPVRVRPTRTLILAAVAVAAAIAVAFAATGVVKRRSTPPASVGTTTLTSTAPPTTIATVFVPDLIGMKTDLAQLALHRLAFGMTRTAVSCAGPLDVVTRQDPLAGTRARSGSTVTLTVCTTHTIGATTTLLVVACDTSEGTSAMPSERAPTSVTVPTPPFDAPNLSGYSDSHGRLPMTGPAGWGCKALDATDGGVAVGITPPGAPRRDSWGVGGKVTQPPVDGVFALSDPACQGCTYTEVCGIVPGVDADFPDFARNGLCAAPPRGQVVTPLGNNTFSIFDPAGTLGPDVAHSVLVYRPRTATTDASVVRETCILPASQRAVCDAVMTDFLALRS